MRTRSRPQASKAQCRSSFLRFATSPFFVQEFPAIAWLERHGSAALAAHPDAQRLLVSAFSGRILDHAHDVRERVQSARALAAVPTDLLSLPPPVTSAATRKKEPKRNRVAADGELIGNYVSTLERITPASAPELAHMEAFYASAGDGFDEETPFGGSDPESTPMLKQLTDAYYKEFTRRDLPGGVEEPAVQLPVYSRQQARVFRMPPQEGDRVCRLGENCICKRKFPQAHCVRSSTPPYTLPPGRTRRGAPLAASSTLGRRRRPRAPRSGSAGTM